MSFLYWFINGSRFEHQSDFHLGYDTECSWKKRLSQPTRIYLDVPHSNKHLLVKHLEDIARRKRAVYRTEYVRWLN